MFEEEGPQHQRSWLREKNGETRTLNGQVMADVQRAESRPGIPDPPE